MSCCFLTSRTLRCVRESINSLVAQNCHFRRPESEYRCNESRFNATPPR
ncbi:hypothetical protein KPATCC21470_4308 [Kitasatospora purpeofusca]